MSEHTQPDQTVQGQPQRGRSPNRHTHSRQPTPSDTQLPANKSRNQKAISPEIAARFQRGIERFYELQAGISLKEAYHRTLQHFFQTGYEASEGRLVPILPPAEELPTLQQFRRWYKQQRLFKPPHRSPENTRDTHRRPSALNNIYSCHSFGPGLLYEIVIVTGEISLLGSADSRSSAAKPTIYLVLDAFSQMIAGVHVTLEAPDWQGVLQAAENAAMDKVHFCEPYGVAITSSQWPAHHLPLALLVEDLCRFSGYPSDISDRPVMLLGVALVNKFPSFEGWKKALQRKSHRHAAKVISIVQSAIRLSHLHEEPDNPSGIHFTLEQFRTLLIRAVLIHNQASWMEWYPLDTDMLADQVDPCPLNLWDWGIQHRPGMLRQVNYLITPFDLHPQHKAPSSQELAEQETPPDLSEEQQTRAFSQAIHLVASESMTSNFIHLLRRVAPGSKRGYPIVGTSGRGTTRAIEWGDFKPEETS